MPSAGVINNEGVLLYLNASGNILTAETDFVPISLEPPMTQITITWPAQEESVTLAGGRALMVPRQTKRSSEAPSNLGIRRGLPAPKL